MSRLGVRIDYRAMRMIICGLALTASIGIMSTVGATAVAPSPGGSPVTVMTQNVDEGTDFGPLFTATTQQDYLLAVAATYQEVMAGDIPERAAEVAREIRQERPDLVALQEVALWRTGPVVLPPAAPSATTIAYDQLQALLDALDQQGLHYAPVAIATNLDAEGPNLLAAPAFDVRVTDRDVLLTRTDRPNLHLANIQRHQFANIANFTSPLGPTPNPRGWISADVTLDAHTFRVVTTHLEADFASIQEAQARELIEGPGNIPLPVLLAGDFNSNGGCGSPKPQMSSTTYALLAAAGYDDAWARSHGTASGCTWPLHGEDPLTAAATPTDRIDLVLYHSGVSVRSVALVGNTPAALTPSGLWPSDHAGVVATLRIP